MSRLEGRRRVREVVVEGLVKRYRWFELRTPALRFGKGLNLILGPNGSGKSTLLKIMAGLVHPNAGSVRYVLEGGAELPPAKACGLLGFVAEDVRLPDMRVSEILEYFSREGADVAGVAELMGLKPYMRKRYYELSNGFRRRVQLAIALLADAEVIIMDEPFSNVDVLMIAPLKHLVRELGREKVVIITSHIDLNLVPDTLTVLNQGRVIYHGEAEKLLRGRYLIEVRVGGKVLSVGVDELNKILREGGGAGVEVLRIVSEDTSEILQKLIGGGAP